MKQIRDMDEPTLKEYFTLLADATESVLPPGTLFALLVFDESCIGQYVSNAKRPEMIRVLRETADRIEANQDVRRDQ